MTFKVAAHKKAIKEIKSLPEPIHSRLKDALEEMKENPLGGDVKELEREEKVFRRRVGDYRIIFSVDFVNNTVYVFKIEKRGAVYKNF